MAVCIYYISSYGDSISFNVIGSVVGGGSEPCRRASGYFHKSVDILITTGSRAYCCIDDHFGITRIFNI